MSMNLDENGKPEVTILVYRPQGFVPHSFSAEITSKQTPAGWKLGHVLAGRIHSLSQPSFHMGAILSVGMKWQNVVQCPCWKDSNVITIHYVYLILGS